MNLGQIHQVERQRISARFACFLGRSSTSQRGAHERRKEGRRNDTDLRQICILMCLCMASDAKCEQNFIGSDPGELAC